MRSVSVLEAQGMVLCHDITRIVPGEGKGPAFRKGHVVTDEDIPVLLRLGKEHIHVWEPVENAVHEDEAALAIAAALAGEGVRIGRPCEGRVDLTADRPGLLVVDKDALRRCNSVEEVTIATLHGDIAVPPGKVLAGARVVPLAVARDRLDRVAAVTAETGPVVSVLPFRALRVGVVTTGSEVYHGRIADRFGPVLRRKFSELGSAVTRQIIVSDDLDMIVGAMTRLLGEGAEMLAVTGGMSVDADDLSPTAIRSLGGDIVTYGAPTFPGAMFMLAYVGEVPVVGLPGCVMYHEASIFDLTVPRILAGKRLTRADIVELGYGGLCGKCPQCRFPDCGFGRH
ncbi:molybdopterin-binding protein [Solidesulfovibrio sp.]|uniref:molybdopterin-binding protein n=1 Tax=Solidesulfovibrio sp. TaxID=2910990 RepID=UPI00261D20AA|nr:molybdopterin-binding protein [Solidesulfovibrio sp.]